MTCLTAIVSDIHVAMHRDKFLIIEQTRCTNFSKFLFLNETLNVSDSSSVHHQEFSTVHTAMVCHTGYADSLRAGAFAPARKLSA